MDKNRVVVITDHETEEELALVLEEEFDRLYSGSAEKYLRDMCNDCRTEYELDTDVLNYNDFRKDPLHISSGNVVRWCGHLYIVGKARWRKEGSLELLPFNAANSKSYPSDTFPLDPRHRISSVERLATCMQDFLVAKFLKILHE